MAKTMSPVLRKILAAALGMTYTFLSAVTELHHTHLADGKVAQQGFGRYAVFETASCRGGVAAQPTHFHPLTKRVLYPQRCLACLWGASNSIKPLTGWALLYTSTAQPFCWLSHTTFSENVPSALPLKRAPPSLL